MSVVVFRDDDAGYLSWLAAHPDGFVLNIARALSVADARLHHASCRTLPRAVDGALTHGYVKVCSIVPARARHVGHTQRSRPGPNVRSVRGVRTAPWILDAGGSTVAAASTGFDRWPPGPRRRGCSVRVVPTRRPWQPDRRWPPRRLCRGRSVVVAEVPPVRAAQPGRAVSPLRAVPPSRAAPGPARSGPGGGLRRAAADEHGRGEPAAVQHRFRWAEHGGRVRVRGPLRTPRRRRSGVPDRLGESQFLRVPAGSRDDTWRTWTARRAAGTVH